MHSNMPGGHTTMDGLNGHLIHADLQRGSEFLLLLALHQKIKNLEGLGGVGVKKIKLKNTFAYSSIQQNTKLATTLLLQRIPAFSILKAEPL